MSETECGRSRNDVKVKLKLWLEKDDRMLIGLGTAKLLLRIQEMGSLKQAAESMGMSYRNAWGKIRDIEKGSGLKLVQKSMDRGRRLQLTGTGQDLAESFVALMTGMVEEAKTRSGPVLEALDS